MVINFSGADFNIEPGRVFTLAELSEKYPNQWLATDVVERDAANGQPTKVTVLKRGVNAFTARDNVGTQTFCTMYTGLIPERNHVGMF